MLYMQSKTRYRKSIVIRAAGLRRELDERGIRHNWLANELGISKSHMSSLIAGRFNVTEKHAEQMCEALGAPFSSLFEFIDRSESRHAESEAA